MEIKIVNKSKHPLPSYETLMSAGMDLRASLDESILLKPLERALIKTNLFMEIPPGFEAQIRSRSGLALKKGIKVLESPDLTVLNSPGTIDSDFRGDVGVILVNLSNTNFIVKDGERIAQMVFAKFERVEWEQVSELSETERGSGGFGHTGNK